MSTNIKKFKIFMASPDDLYEERKIFGEVIEAINRSRGDVEGFHLDAIVWEKYAYPEAHNPQAIANKLLGEAAMVVVAFWNKFGAPTKDFPSGTMEEFAKAYEKRKATGKPSIKIYFRQPTPPTTLPQIDELRKILEFKESINDKALYKVYVDDKEFKDLIQEHINAWASSTVKPAEIQSVQISDTAKIEPVSDMRSVLGALFKEIEKKYDGSEKPNIYFGLPQLDLYLRQLDENNLILVAGDASTGKTTLLITLANIISASGKPVLFISPRLHKKDIGERLICNNGGVALNRIKSGALRDSDWSPVANAAGRLSEQPIYLDDNYSISVSHIRQTITELMASHGLHLVIVDGLNYIQQGNDKLGQALRVLSREHQVPIIGSLDMSAILSNKKYYGSDKRPLLEDLDKIGDFRAEADTIIFMHRDTDYVDNYEIIISKNKDGPRGTVKVRLMSHLCKFEEIEIE